MKRMLLVLFVFLHTFIFAQNQEEEYRVPPKEVDIGDTMITYNTLKLYHPASHKKQKIQPFKEYKVVDIKQTQKKKNTIFLFNKVEKIQFLIEDKQHQVFVLEGKYISYFLIFKTLIDKTKGTF